MPCSPTCKSPPLARRRSSRTVPALTRCWLAPGPGRSGSGAGTPTPRQLAHGDFLDDNVFFRREAPVFAVDFSFMAERARVEGLALTLY